MTKNVLIVDDSIFIYEEIKYILADTDYRVVGYAKDGAQALKMYEELKPDVVTMDIVMPGANGIEISQEIMERWKDAKIIVISSLAYDKTMEKAEAAGVCDFLFKPLKREEFIAALDRAVGTDPV
ncbi:MAG: response regulator [Firmicutes bacterium]|nr:response regulator [Bacillota bacterium]